MADPFLDGPAVQPPQINAVVDHYLASLARDLPGPRGARAAALDEVRDGLHEAIAGHTSRGLPPQLAARAAITELGSPTTVAEAFAPELATTQARHTLLAFLITGPLVGLWWLLLLAPQPWPPRPGVLWAAIPALPLIGVAIAAAVVILATTGSLIRWLPESTPQRALLGAAGVAIGCVLDDLTVLAILAARSLATTWQPPSRSPWWRSPAASSASPLHGGPCSAVVAQGITSTESAAPPGHRAERPPEPTVAACVRDPVRDARTAGFEPDCHARLVRTVRHDKKSHIHNAHLAPTNATRPPATDSTTFGQT